MDGDGNGVTMCEGGGDEDDMVRGVVSNGVIENNTLKLDVFTKNSPCTRHESPRCTHTRCDRNYNSSFLPES